MLYNVYYWRIDEINVFYIDLRIDKLYSLDVLCRSNDVVVVWCSLIEPKRVVRNVTNNSKKN